VGGGRKKKRKTGKKKALLMYIATLCHSTQINSLLVSGDIFFCDKKFPAGFGSLIWLLLVDHMKKV